MLESSGYYRLCRFRREPSGISGSQFYGRTSGSRFRSAGKRRLLIAVPNERTIKLDVSIVSKGLTSRADKTSRNSLAETGPRRKRNPAADRRAKRPRDPAKPSRDETRRDTATRLYYLEWLSGGSSGPPPLLLRQEIDGN